jgi:hypothetical protein
LHNPLLPNPQSHTRTINNRFDYFFERVHILSCVPGHAQAALQEWSFWPQPVHRTRKTALGLRALKNVHEITWAQKPAANSIWSMPASKKANWTAAA